MARDNRSLGRFHLNGIPPAPRGVPQIEVSFDIDANGILNVSAKDLATNQQQAITITSSSGLSEDEIARMIKDAEKNQAEDKKKKEDIENKNKLDQITYSLDKLVRENKEKLPDGMALEVETAVKEAQDASKSNDPVRIKDQYEKINQLTQRISTELYKNVQTPGTPNPETQPNADAPQNPGSTEGEVIDAEYEDVNKG
jgi:molecular chaperone DnaK